MRFPSRRAGEATMLDALLLRLGRATAATMDVPAVLADVCRTLRAALGVRGVVAVAAGAPEGAGLGPVAGSDEVAVRLGRVQRDARGGPLAAVVRSGRPLRTPDLTRVGPPELAAAAADTGITEAVTVALSAGGRAVGAVQLLGDAGQRAEPGRAAAVGPVLEVLAARLADVDELRRRREPAAAPGDAEAATAVLPVAARERSADPVPAADVDAATVRLPIAAPAEAVVEAAGETSVLPAAVPPAPRPPGPAEMLVPVPRYHEPGAATFGAAVDRADDGAGAEPPPAAAGAGAPAHGPAREAGSGALTGATGAGQGPRRGRRHRGP